MKPFCIICGKEEHFEKSMCRDCFSETIDFEDLEDITIKKCKVCELFAIKNAFLEKETIAENLKKKIEKEIQKNIKTDTAKTEIAIEITELEKVSVKIAISKDMQKIEFQKELNIVQKETLCEKCTKIRGKYYEAIVQIRCDKKEKIEDIKEYIYQQIEHLSKKSSDIKISEIKEVKGGIDYYFPSKKVAQKIVRTIKSKFITYLKETYKLKGQDHEGREEYRATYSLRILGYSINDVVIKENVPYKIVAYEKNRFKLLNLDTNNETVISHDKIFNNKSIKVKKPENMNVIAKWQNTIQVSNEDNSETYEIGISEQDIEIGDKVKIIKFKNKRYLLA